jgi:hypothetical protein
MPAESNLKMSNNSTEIEMKLKLSELEGPMGVIKSKPLISQIRTLRPRTQPGLKSSSQDPLLLKTDLGLHPTSTIH